MGKVVNKIWNLTLVTWFMNDQGGLQHENKYLLSTFLRGGDVYTFELFQRSLDFVMTSDSVT